MCRIKRLLVTVLFLVGAAPGVRTHYGCPLTPNHNCPQLDSSLEVVFRHDKYMDRYYRCISGVAYEFQCPFGLAFDPFHGRCRCAMEYDIVSWHAKQLIPCEKCVEGVKFVALGAFLPQYLQCVSPGIAELKSCPVGQTRASSVQLIWMSDHCEGFLPMRGLRYDDYPSTFHHPSHSIPYDDWRGSDDYALCNNHHGFGYPHVHGSCPCEICRQTSVTATPCSTSTSSTPSTTTTEITTHSETPSTTTTEITTDYGNPDEYGIYDDDTTEISTHSETTTSTTADTTTMEITTQSGNSDDSGEYYDDPLVGAGNPFVDEESFWKHSTTTIKPKTTTTIKPTTSTKKPTTTTIKPTTSTKKPTTTTIKPTTSTKKPTTTTNKPTTSTKKPTTTTIKPTTSTKKPTTTTIKPTTSTKKPTTTTVKPTTTTTKPTTTTTEKPTTTTEKPTTTTKKPITCTEKPTTTTERPTTTTENNETTCLCVKKSSTTTTEDTTTTTEETTTEEQETTVDSP